MILITIVITEKEDLLYSFFFLDYTAISPWPIYRQQRHKTWLNASEFLSLFHTCRFFAVHGDGAKTCPPQRHIFSHRFLSVTTIFRRLSRSGKSLHILKRARQASRRLYSIGKLVGDKGCLIADDKKSMCLKRSLDGFRCVGTKRIHHMTLDIRVSHDWQQKLHL